MIKIVLIVHNVRSAHNVGSMLRTADGLGISEVFLCGYTPYPIAGGDTRMPHIAAKTSRQIHKTALGAEDSVIWHHNPDIKIILGQLRVKGFRLVALEQTKRAVDLVKFKPGRKVAMIVGSEIGGLPHDVLDMCDEHIQILMAGKKESFNVAVAAAMAMYHLKFLA